MQLIASRVAQSYNQRKNRKGAYWQDRYHATAVDTDTYLARCMAYIDLNMVRAGVVSHPREWSASGYHEIQTPSQRYRIVELERLQQLVGVQSFADLQQRHLEWIDAAINDRKAAHEALWSNSIAVGSEDYVAKVKAQLGLKAKYRSTDVSDGAFFIKESSMSYMSDFPNEMDFVRQN